MSSIKDFRVACASDNIDAVIELFELGGIGIDPKTFIDKKSKETMLHIAADMDATDIVSFLLTMKEELELDVNAVDSRGNVAIYYAATNGDEDMVKEFIDAGANPDFMNRHNATPLYIACLHKNPEMIYMLLEAGAKVIRPYFYRGFFSNKEGSFDNLLDMYVFSMTDAERNKGEDYKRVVNILKNALKEERGF